MQLNSTNVFLYQKKKIDLSDLAFPKINNENIFPFKVVFRYNFLAMICPCINYMQAILLGMVIGLPRDSPMLQMGLAIPINILVLLYYIRARPYSFKVKHYRIKNYLMIINCICLIVLEMLLFGLGSL